MKRSPVQSSNVAAIGYDPYTETLEVEFRPNREGLSPVWRYAPVPRALFADLFGEGASVGAGVATLRMNADVRAMHVDDVAPTAHEEPAAEDPFAGALADLPDGDDAAALDPIDDEDDA